MNEELVERIYWGETCLAFVIRSSFLPEETSFLTPLESNQQVGYVVYPAGGEITRHVHHPIERRIIGTSEALIILRGRCEADIYNDDRRLVTTRELSKGDVLLMISGGHGFRILEDTVFLEIKQGPYVGGDEKERF